MSIVFHWYPQSSASPIACALAELQVPHERVKVDIQAGEQRRPEFLALNPNGKVPTLTVDGAPLFEALAIHLWLGEQWGVERGLWPEAGTSQRLAAMSWCTWAYVTYGAVVSRLYVVAHGDEQSRDARLAERAIADLDSLLGLLDAHLTRQPWMVGDQYSLADLVVASVVGYTAFLGAPVAAHPKVQAWLSTIKARPAMQGEV